MKLNKESRLNKELNSLHYSFLKDVKSVVFISKALRKKILLSNDIYFMYNGVDYRYVFINITGGVYECSLIEQSKTT